MSLKLYWPFHSPLLEAPSFAGWKVFIFLEEFLCEVQMDKMHFLAPGCCCAGLCAALAPRAARQ